MLMGVTPPWTPPDFSVQTAREGSLAFRDGSSSQSHAPWASGRIVKERGREPRRDAQEVRPSTVVGVGCLKELSEAQRAGVPVAMLDHRCRPRGYGGLALPARAPTTRRAAVLLPGEPVDLGELFGLPTTKGAE